MGPFIHIIIIIKKLNLKNNACTLLDHRNISKFRTKLNLQNVLSKAKTKIMFFNCITKFCIVKK